MPRQVQLSDEAYRTLASLKARGESFSEVVQRLAASGKDLRALQGLGPRLQGWDDEKFHRHAAETDRQMLERLMPGRPRRRRVP